MPLLNCPDCTDTPSLSAWDTLVERRIRAACEAGQFDNLGGSGRSLRLRDNPYVAPSGEVLAGVLKEANLRSAWIEESQEIRAVISRFREKLRVTKDMQRAWHQVAHLKKKIAAFNVVALLLQFQLPLLNLQRELQRCGVTDR